MLIKARLNRIRRRHGRLKGLYRHWLCLSIHRLGCLKRFQQVRWSQVSRLVFVCKGNISRSPYAEARARALKVPAASFGLAADGRSGAEPLAVEVARCRGIDLAAHRSRTFGDLSIRAGDLLIAMEPWQGKQLLHLARDTGAQVTLLGLCAKRPCPHIEDPFALGKQYYHVCFALIDSAVQEIANHLKAKEPAHGLNLTIVRNWRSSYPVLVAEAHTLGSVAVIRSLGSAGYPVYAMSCQPDALGCLSNYARARVECPAYDHPQFLTWFRQCISRHNIRAIIPSESLLLVLRPQYRQFSELLPFSRRQGTVYLGMSKCDVFQMLTESGHACSRTREHLPPSLLVDQSGSIPDQCELQRMGTPLFLKVDAVHSRNTEPSRVYKADSVQEAAARLKELLPRFSKVLVQGYVPGQGVGVFFLLWQGQVLAQFMHRRIHEVPYSGGVSSLRESWWHELIRDDALAKLKHIDWQGVAMMEYRWDAGSDQFHFIEMNGRFWGSLHLAMRAGVDFPRFLMDAFNERYDAPVNKFRLGVKCRDTFPAEVQYVWSRLKDRDSSRISKTWPLVEFLLLCCDPRVYCDLLFGGDCRLYWVQLGRFSKEFFATLAAKLRG